MPTFGRCIRCIQSIASRTTTSATTDARIYPTACHKHILYLFMHLFAEVRKHLYIHTYVCTFYLFWLSCALAYVRITDRICERQVSVPSICYRHVATITNIIIYHAVICLLLYAWQFVFVYVAISLANTQANCVNVYVCIYRADSAHFVSYTCFYVTWVKKVRINALKYALKYSKQSLSAQRIKGSIYAHCVSY